MRSAVLLPPNAQGLKDLQIALYRIGMCAQLVDFIAVHRTLGRTSTNFNAVWSHSAGDMSAIDPEALGYYQPQRGPIEVNRP